MVDLRADTASSSDKTEFTETEDQGAMHHGSTLGTDPCRTSTKPSTSNEPVCGLRSLGEQPNQKSSIDQRSSDEEPDKPSSKHRDSSATQSSAHSDPVVEHRTSVSVYGLRPAESGKHQQQQHQRSVGSSQQLAQSSSSQSRSSHSRSSRWQPLLSRGAQPHR